MADNNQIDPQQLQQMPQQAPSGIFPNPLLQAQAPPSGLDQLTQAALSQAQFGREQMGETLARQRALADQIAPLQQRQAELAPNLAYHPHMAPITGQGVGHDILNFLGDLGKGALAAGAGTGIGQNVQAAIYGPQRREYANLAGRIKQIQGQSETEAKTLEPEAQMGYHPMYSAVRAGTEGAELPIKQMNAETQRIAVNNQKTLRDRALQIEQDYNNKKISLGEAQNRMRQTVAEIQQGTATTVAGMYADQRQAAVETEAAQSYLKTEADYWLQRLTGTLPKPPVGTAAGPQAKPSASLPGGVQRGAQKGANPQGKTGQQGKGTVTLTSGGRQYNIPRHMVGEFKKDHPDAR